MSLVNEALKKARLEAARQEAARRGLPLPGARTPAPRPTAGPGLLRVGMAAALVALAALLFLIGRMTSPEPGDTPPGDSRVAAASVESAGAPVESFPTAEAALPEPVSPTPQPVTVADAADEPPAPPPASPAEDRSAVHAPPTQPQEPPRPDRSSRIRVRTSLEPPAAAEPAVAPPVASVPPPAARSASAAPVDSPAPPDLRTEVRTLELPGSRRIELGGIAWSEERPFALINGRVVGPGDTVESLTVVEIRQRAVELKGDAGHFLLRLK